MLLLDSLEDHALMQDKDSTSLNKPEEVAEFVPPELPLALLELAAATALSIKTWETISLDVVPLVLLLMLHVDLLTSSPTTFAK